MAYIMVLDVYVSLRFKCVGFVSAKNEARGCYCYGRLYTPHSTSCYDVSQTYCSGRFVGFIALGVGM